MPYRLTYMLVLKLMNQMGTCGLNQSLTNPIFSIPGLLRCFNLLTGESKNKILCYIKQKKTVA